MCARIHIAPYPFAAIPTFEGKLAGGLQAVFAAESEANTGKNRRLRILSTDAESRTFPDRQTDVVATCVAQLPLQYWFGDLWSKLHSRAYTLPHQSPDALTAIFRGCYTEAFGTFARMIEHYRIYPVREPLMSAFTESFRKRLAEVLLMSATDDIVVNWQDPQLFFHECIREHAPELRRSGIFQTGHIHTAYPDDFALSAEGQEILQNMRPINRLYVHTERYRASLCRHLQELHARDEERVPEVCRFDLGIDGRLLDRLLHEVTVGNYSDVLGMTHLHPDQRSLLEEMVRVKGQNMHCFLNIDRADPGKGVTVWLDAIEQFLQSQEKHTHIASHYRFFGVHQFLDTNVFEAHDTRHQYIQHVQRRYEELRQRFPGIVFTCASLPKIAIPFLADDCYPCSACIEDGLNLAWQEMTYVNAMRGRSRVGIMSRGSGFGDEAVRRGFGANALFPSLGNAEAFAQCMEQSVSLHDHDPARARSMTLDLVERHIMQRSDSVIVAPA